MFNARNNPLSLVDVNSRLRQAGWQAILYCLPSFFVVLIVSSSTFQRVYYDEVGHTQHSRLVQISELALNLTSHPLKHILLVVLICLMLLHFDQIWLALYGLSRVVFWLAYLFPVMGICVILAYWLALCQSRWVWIPLGIPIGLLIAYLASLYLPFIDQTVQFIGSSKVFSGFAIGMLTTLYVYLITWM